MDNTKRYFEENSEFWINDAYISGEYNYPVGFNRLRILNKIVNEYNPIGKTLIDIGCGGGDICIAMAEKGFTVIGVDMSESMLEIANKRREGLPIEIAQKIKFIKSDFEDIQKIIKKNSADVIVAFGLIGYLPNDDDFFRTSSYLLKDSGKLIVSFRNRLFNMESISNYTVKEINNKSAIGLIEELNELFKEDIPLENIKDFVSNLKTIINNLDMDKFANTINNKNDMVDIYNNELSVEARQHTPKDALNVSKKYNFKNIKNYGVHPHLLVPRLNNMLTPQLFNKLSDSLCSFEELPVSLAWSSVFISEFEKRI